MHKHTNVENCVNMTCVHCSINSTHSFCRPHRHSMQGSFSQGRHGDATTTQQETVVSACRIGQNHLGPNCDHAMVPAMVPAMVMLWLIGCSKGGRSKGGGQVLMLRVVGPGLLRHLRSESSHISVQGGYSMARIPKMFADRFRQKINDFPQLHPTPSLLHLADSMLLSACSIGNLVLPSSSPVYLG